MAMMDIDSSMEQFEGKLYSNPRVAPPMLSLEDIHVDDISRDIPIGSILFFQQEKRSAREKGIHSFTGQCVLPRMLVSTSLQKKTNWIRGENFRLCHVSDLAILNLQV
jgi:hypothetical protein